MQIRSFTAMLIAATLLAGTVSALTFTTDEGAAGTYERGESFIVTTDVTFDCTEYGIEPADEVVTIANKADFEWLNASEETVTYEPGPDCITGGGSVTVEDVELNLTIGVAAPAFEDFELQPGVVGGENEGGAFTIQVAYDPAFSAPGTLSFDSIAGGTTATIPLTVAANADSVFSFDVTSFTFDGEDAPEGATAEIADTLAVDSPLAAGELAQTHNVELQFAPPADAEDEAAAEDGFRWETAVAVLEVTLAAAEDATQSSDPREVRITFANTDEATLPGGDDDDGGDGNGGDTDGDGFFKKLPGYEAIATVAALGMVAVLARRRN